MSCAVAVVALIGCTRSAPAPVVDRQDLEAVASAYLECPRERIRRVRPAGHELGAHMAFYEGCGRQGTFTWSRGEVPFTPPKGWSASPTQLPPFDASDSSP